MRWIALLVVVALAGCTTKFTAEGSIMKQWDRPAENTTTSTTDTSRNVAPQQGSVGVVK